MSRRALAAILSLALGGCVFSSEQPFFREDEGVAALGQGAEYAVFDAPSFENEHVVYRRSGAGYDIVVSEKGGARMPRVLFVPITDTPQEDYVAQIALDRDDSARAYAFMWRVDSNWHVVIAPSAFPAWSVGAASSVDLCPRRDFDECHISRREALLTFYRDDVWPVFVRDGQTPERYWIQSEVATEAATIEKS